MQPLKSDLFGTVWRSASSEGREYVLRGRGYVKELEDIESSVVAVGRGGVPVRLRDVARVQYGPDIRRGAADLNGTGETVGGIVVMRIGSNALDVIRALEAQIASLRLPDGVRLIPTYDRSELIIGSVNTLTNTLMQQAVIVTIICLVFLFHARSALIVMIVLPGREDDLERLNQIAEAYKSRFRQQSVGIILRGACVSF